MRAPPLVLAHAPDSAKSTVSTSQHSLDDARVPESVVVFGDEWLVGDASMDLCVRPASPSGVPDLSSDRHVDRIVPGFRITDLSGRVLYRMDSQPWMEGKGRRTLLDAHGNCVCTLKRNWLRAKWSVYRGSSTARADRLFTVGRASPLARLFRLHRNQFSIHLDNVDGAAAATDSTTRQPRFALTRDALNRFQLVQTCAEKEGAAQNSIVVADCQRQMMAFNAPTAFLLDRDARNAFHARVRPGVDGRFVAVLVVLLNLTYDKTKGGGGDRDE